MNRKVLGTAAALAPLGLLLGGRMFFESRREYIRGREALEKGAVEEAIRHFDRAAHWYAPGNPWVGRAVAGLFEIGSDHEKTDPRTALLAYDSGRGSLRAIRSLYQPQADWVPRFDARIAELRADEEVARGAKEGRAELVAKHAALLARDPRPRKGWAVLLEIGFFGWIASTLGLIFRGHDREGNMRLPSALPWIVGMIAGFALFAIGLLRA